ncbi:MAG: hypothetical protein ACRCX2_24020 [Paraclostridium sp.]
MATKVILKNNYTGQIKEKAVGFSGTVFCFGCLPMMCRGNWIDALIYILLTVVVGVCTYGIGTIVLWIAGGVMYNNYEVKRMLKNGWTAIDETNEMILKSNGLWNVR